MIWTLLRRALARFHQLRMPRPPAHQGATLLYAGELHAMAAEPGWLNPEEQASAQRLANSARVTRGYLRQLDHIQRRTEAGLDRLWRETCATLHLDPIDIEWAVLASGELIIV